MILQSPPHSILVICARRIGDALLTTPLINTLKTNWPDAAIDVLAFEGIEGILRHNSDIRRIITIPEQQPLYQKMAFLWKMWNQYDLAISTQTGDRPTLYAFIAGRKSIGPCTQHSEKWKKLLLNAYVDFDGANTHIITQNLKLCERLGLAPIYDVKLAWAAKDEVTLAKKCSFDMTKPYIVIHPVPKFKYKMWHQPGWIHVSKWITQQNIQVVFTAGHSLLEQEYIQQICQHLPLNATNFAGKLTLSELAFLLTNASAYVGVDTVTTHMAAASGIPTIAIFGPTSPAVWGPWPVGCRDRKPFQEKGSQQHNNVTLLQSDEPACIPCQQEGCFRHQNSESICLNLFPAEKVVTALKELPLFR